MDMYKKLLKQVILKNLQNYSTYFSSDIFLKISKNG